MDNQASIERNVLLESRLTKVETLTNQIQEDIRDIKKNLHWLTGIIFSINSAILGVVTKGFGIL